MIQASLPNQEILDLWNQLFPPYSLDWRLFEQNTLAHWQQEGRQVLVDREGGRAIGRQRTPGRPKGSHGMGGGSLDRAQMGGRHFRGSGSGSPSLGNLG